MCFSVNRGVAIPPSLRNIYQEIKNDLGIEPPKHGNLLHWADQGVLLLNTVLTVPGAQGQLAREAGMGDIHGRGDRGDQFQEEQRGVLAMGKSSTGGCEGGN